MKDKLESIWEKWSCIQYTDFRNQREKLNSNELTKLEDSFKVKVILFELK